VQQLHRPVHEAGLFLTLLVSGLWFGSMIAVRLLRRHTARHLLVRANLLGQVMAVLFLGMALMDWLSLASVAGLMFVYALGVGVAAPTALAEAVNVNPAVIGTASGIYGFSQMAVGALCSALVGLGSNPALSAALVLVAAGLVSQLTFWLAAGPRQQSDR
jgi:DHA1 family bicyclomycin/chloramphenicol resistance-like MFS transporter